MFFAERWPSLGLQGGIDPCLSYYCCVSCPLLRATATATATVKVMAKSESTPSLTWRMIKFRFFPLAMFFGVSLREATYISDWVCMHTHRAKTNKEEANKCGDDIVFAVFTAETGRSP